VPLTSTLASFLGWCTWREAVRSGSIGTDLGGRHETTPFSYAAPTTLAEAVGLLTEHAEAEPRVLAAARA